MKIARIATIPFFLQNHLREQICATVAAGHDVMLVSSGGPEVPLLTGISGVRFHRIEIPRKISPLRDLLSLWQLLRLFRRERFDIVHSTTPKAGLLTAVAARLAGIPIRLHTFTGQAWMEMHGVLRMLAKAGDRVTAALNTQCYADSVSQRDFIIAEGVAAPRQLHVLGAGSLAGVNLQRFNPDEWTGRRNAIRTELGIASGTKVITFIGRLTKDKGIEELVVAFQSLRDDGVGCTLLLVGPRDSDWDKLPAAVRHAIASDSRILSLGYSSEPERYLAITDVFCLPSYREGFGNVVIEAAAMGVATVGTNIVGLKDAIVDGKTGVLVPPKNHTALASALAALIADDEQRAVMGDNARFRAANDFDSRVVNAAVVSEYQRLGELHLKGRVKG